MLKIAVFTFLTVLLVMVVSPSVCTVKAQSDVTINILSAIGGTTSPTAGTQTYNSGQTATFTATADGADFFAYWTVQPPSGSVTENTDNPLTITLTAGTYNIQAVFQPLNVAIPAPAPSPNPSTQAVVIILSAVGGTTSPAPGTYTLANAASLQLTATALNGWVFDHWVIGGYPLTHGGYNFTDTPTDNPYNVNHGYGYTYSYQPVFSLTSSSPSTPSVAPTTPEFSSAAILGVVITLIAVLLISGIYTQRKRK